MNGLKSSVAGNRVKVKKKSQPGNEVNVKGLRDVYGVNSPKVKRKGVSKDFGSAEVVGQRTFPDNQGNGQKIEQRV